MNTATTHADIAMTKRGRLIYLDDSGYREFSPRTVRALQFVTVAFVSVVTMLAILIGTGLMPPTPWSPMSRVDQIDNEQPVPSLPDDWSELVPVNPEGPQVELPEPGTNV